MKQAKQVIPVRQTFAVRGILFLGVLLLVFLVMHPREGFASAKEGMTLWLNTLLPTLLPFMILTGILIHTGGIEKLLTPLAPVFRFLLGVDVYGGYVFLLGMLCGYPMGAKLASDLYEAGKISHSEAHYLTTFCNHASPAFVITYLGQHCLKGTVPVSRMFISLLSADFICMLFFRFRIYPKTKTSISTGREHNKPPHIRRVNICEENIRKKDIHKENIRGLNIREEKKETSAAAVSVGGILDVSIMNGFETITRLGGYILLFSILTGCIRYYRPFPALIQYILLGITEITTGLSLFASADIPWTLRCVLSVTATGFGGLCILAQTRSILHKDLSLIPYLSAKCISGLLSGILMLCYLN